MSKPIKLKTATVIEVSEWDKLVKATYSKPYNLQQQDGCSGRGNIIVTVPDEGGDFPNDTVPEIVNGPEMGVSFKAWLARDPKEPLHKGEECRTDQWAIDLWWGRNFYPSLQMVANDLHAKGILPAGTHTINIDW